jgi:hypothetical protein
LTLTIQKAIISLTDIAARKYVRNTLGKDVLPFSVTYATSLEMKTNAENSFVNKLTWKNLIFSLKIKGGLP